MMKYDAVVLGGGISALTSALLFAKKGKKVAVFEQSPTLAPLFSGFERNGVHFDAGFHYSGALGPDEVGGYMFKKLGLDVEVEQCDPEGYDYAYLEKSGRIFKIPSGYERFENRLIAFFPEEKEGIKKYFRLAKKEIDGIPFLNFHKRRYSLEEMYSFASLDKTLSEVLDECFKNEELKSILSFGSILYGVPPAQASFMLHCCCNGIMYESVWKFKNGAKSIVDAYVKALKENGAALFTNKTAVKIEARGGEKTVRFKDGLTVSCEICAASIHPKEFIKIAPEGAYRRKTVDRINALEETRAFFMLFAKARQRLFGKSINNAGFLYKDGYKTAFKDFIYINFAGQDQKAVSAVMCVDSDEKIWNLADDEYRELKNAYIQKIKNHLDKCWPEAAGKMELLGAATPRTFKRWVNYYSAYGIKRKFDASVSVIPPTKIPGLFLIGQATVAPGLIGAMISAFLLDKMLERRSA